jgi:hypothetical protein
MKFKETNCEKFSNLDLFGQPVELTFKGYNRFRTPFGAILTMLTGCIIVSYIVTEFLIVSKGSIK